MKHKILSFLTALAMVLGIVVQPFATANAKDEANQTNTVTVHKVLMSKEDLAKHDANKKHDGKQLTGQNFTDFFSANAKEIPNVYFAVKNEAGTAYIKEDGTETQKVEEALGGLTGENNAGLKLNTAKLKGKYQIVEVREKTTYKGENEELLAASKAVPVLITLPLVNESGIVADAHVYPKNTQEKPRIDKNFTSDSGLEQAAGFDAADKGAEANVGAKYENYSKKKATAKAEIGKVIPYEVKTEIPRDAKYKKLVWNDTMTKGLTFNKDSVEISGAGLTAEDYIIFADDRGFELKLNGKGIKKVEDEAAKGQAFDITLKYKATVNSDAVVDIPEANDVKFDYSNNPGKDSEPKTTTPVDQKINVKKSWAVDGDTVNEADQTVEVVYTLQKQNDQGQWENVKTVTKKYDEQNPQESFNHTFEGLEDGKTYRVVERVSGYEPEYLTTTENGTIEIRNDKDSNEPKTLNPTEPKVVFGGRKFVKTNFEDKGSDALERLTGATFYVKKGNQYLVADKKDAKAVATAKTALDEAVKAYNGLTAEQQEGQDGIDKKAAIDTAQEAYNKAFIENASAYRWGEKTDNNVVVLTSDGQGRFEIKGIEYGSYQLEEKDAPKGYAPLNGPVDFEVKKGSYDSDNQELQYNKADANNGYGKQIQNKKVSIPATGGIGSLIFVVAGIAIMGLAAYKMKANKQEA